MSILDEIPSNIGWYLSGFVDGEGSFNISFRRKADYKISWQPVLSFNVSQKERTVLDLLRQYFRCGIIKQRKDGLYSYDLTTPSYLASVVIPFFYHFPLFSKNKRANFYIFEKAVNLMTQKRHLTPEGLAELIDLREEINQGKGRKRKYTKENMFLESPETIRRLPIKGMI